MAGLQDLSQYKTLILRCGFSENRHGYLNPSQDMIDGKHPSFAGEGKQWYSDDYQPVPFVPTNPYDQGACYCNVALKDLGANGNPVMMTEEGEIFDEDTIVEFKYDIDRMGAWKWVPLRVRHDKTAEFLSGAKNYGNAYDVANNNWHSIHNPITDEMISSGQNIPETTTNDDVYYNRLGKNTTTRSLRDFHNLYVKRKLIVGAAQRGDTLIDYAVGKGGDWSKWIAANLSFVFGVDVSRDNIENHLDGACARYLNNRKKFKVMPDALFVHGNSSLNIRNGDALQSMKDKEIANAVFGKGAKDKTVLGAGVYKQYGVAQGGFQISSCQFAMHYFFENRTTFHRFMQNVSECTKVGGYFVSTCYDGGVVFDMLRNKNKGESVTIMRSDEKMYELTKMYDETGFPEDEASLGYAIDVYQETINKEFREYLVNYQLVVRTMENYGFVLITDEEAAAMELPKGSALFSELFDRLESELKQFPKLRSEYGTAHDMSPEEKQVSFMNRYFVFRKVRNVDSANIAKITEAERLSAVLEDELDEEENLAEVVKGEVKVIRRLNVPSITLKKFKAAKDLNAETVDAVEPKVIVGQTVKIKLAKK
jgi:hypothetical protein